MKKALSLILALVMCLSLWACGGSADILIPTGGGNTNNSTTQETEGEAMVLYDAEYGYPFVNQARFHELLEKWS